MTFSKSDLLYLFLEAAYRGTCEVDPDEKDKKTRYPKARDFEVLVCETAPSFSGHVTVKKLLEVGIPTKVLTDCSAYAFMSRIDKVIIAAHAVLANGGIVAESGAYMIALAAKVSKTYLNNMINIYL